MQLKDHYYLIFEKKDYLKRIPIAPLERYDDSSKEMAIVMTFRGKPMPQEGEFSDKYVHSSIACLRSLQLNTDIVERKIPVYFFIDDTIPSYCVDMLVSHGVKSERIILYDRGETQVQRFYSGQNFKLLTEPALMEYNHIVTWDADLFACCNPEIDEKLSVWGLRSDKVGAYNYRHLAKDYTDNPAWFHRWNNCLEDVDKNLGRTKEALASVTDIEVSWRSLSNVSSLILSYPMKQLPDGFVEFCVKVGNAIGSEELTLSLWCQHTDTSLQKLRLRPLRSNWNAVAETRNETAYYTHVYVKDNEPEPDIEALFHKDIGAS